MIEKPLVFACGAESLVGVLSLPNRAERLGVVVVVGGPQYRTGSHRQFVSLARALAAGGFACLRFDYRGMGDSASVLRSFEDVDEDIRAAIDTLYGAVAGLDGVVLWGLCDGASASLMYARNDARVVGLVALNPWVRTAVTLAAARLNHYYKHRALSPQFWKRLLTGEVAIYCSLEGVAAAVTKRMKGIRDRSGQSTQPFIERMGEGWRTMGGRTLIMLSGNDLTAHEFADFCRARPEWHAAIAPGSNFAEIADADHTLSRREWKHAAEQMTLHWLRRRVTSLAATARRDG